MIKMFDNKSFVVGTIFSFTTNFIVRLRGIEGISLFHAELMLVLIMVLLFDYIVGYRIAKRNNTYQSSIAIDAIIRDAIMIGIAAMFFLVDRILETGALLYTVIVFAMIWNSLQSFVANIYVLGWQRYYPVWLFNIVNSEINAKLKKYMKNTDHDDHQNSSPR